MPEGYHSTIADAKSKLSAYQLIMCILERTAKLYVPIALHSALAMML